MTETTTHVSDPDGIGRLPKAVYAVRIRGLNTNGRKTAVIFTHDRKPAAARHLTKCEKLGMDVELLEGTIEWQTL